ncbi:hypothetical protein O7542_03025 [Micromonospora sp. WMMC264]|uniref:hypothetical protein n=1 Tax=Micromonospora sp. WMMC264 TaxID=3015158 RepID=UPI00248BA14D|nr:hypothetical protein [Micromonospora sp. WMMC264]WBB86133.1 hypothetical protein O7542_03025 [Micromonospora sp. WMMC264]
MAAAAGTVTSETGVGALVGYGVAAAEAANMFRLWGEATKLCQQIAATVLICRTALTRELSDLDTVALPSLPDGGHYDHPLAGQRRYGYGRPGRHHGRRREAQPSSAPRPGPARPRHRPATPRVATAVQEGQLTLRQEATSDTYGTTLTAPLQAFWTAYQEMTPEEREDLAANLLPPGRPLAYKFWALGPTASVPPSMTSVGCSC